MAVPTKKWDPVERLNSPAAIAAYVEAAFEDGDPSVIAAVLGDVARAKGMTEMSKQSGVSRDTLYKALNENGNPTLETLSAVMQSLGLKLTVKEARS
jgi:probable addiction module antidote protein